MSCFLIILVDLLVLFKEKFHYQIYQIVVEKTFICITKRNNELYILSLLSFCLKSHPLVCYSFALKINFLFSAYLFLFNIPRNVLYFVCSYRRKSRSKMLISSKEFEAATGRLLLKSAMFCDKNNITLDILLIVYNVNQTQICNGPFCYQREEEIRLKRITQ